MSEPKTEPKSEPKPESGSVSPNGSRSPRAAVDWTACRGHGGCADLLPERISLDEWGYPIIDPEPVPGRARRRARKAVSECPALALRLLS